MSVGNRLFWIVRILLLNLLFSIAFSWRLWFQFEGLPQIPVVEFLPTLLPIAQKIITGIGIAYLLTLLIFPKSRLPLGIGIVLIALVGMQDWHRIQPWFMQSLALLTLLIPLQRLYRKYEPLQYLEWAVRLGLVGFYVWAGLFKLNPGFNDYVIPYVVSPITNYLSSFKTEIFGISAIMPYAEILLSLGLLFRRVSFYAVLGLLGMHFTILILLGPVGVDTNPIIWIWNLGMMAMLWIGFGKNDPEFSTKFLYKTKRISWVALTILLILPMFNLFGIYNKSAAFEIYSGTNYVDNVKIPISGIRKDFSEIEPFSYKYKDSLYIRTYELYDAKYNLPPNPDPKVIRRLQDKIKLKLQ